MLSRKLVILFLGCFGFASAQQTIIKIDSLLRYNKVEEAENYILFLERDSIASIALYKAMLAVKKKEQDNILAHLRGLRRQELISLETAFYNRTIAYAFSLSNLEEQAYSYFIKAQKQFDSLGYFDYSNRLNYPIYYLINSQEGYVLTGEEVLDRLYKNGIKYNDTIALFNAYLGRAVQNFKASTKSEFYKEMNNARRLAISLGDSTRMEIYHNYVGLYHSQYSKTVDSAMYHLKKSLDLSLKYGQSDDIYYAYVNLATIPRRAGEYESAIVYLKRADSIGVKGYNINNKRNIYKWLASDFENLGIQDSALYYLNKYTALTTNSRLDAQNRNLALLQTREIQLEKQLETKKRMLNKSLLIAALIALGLGLMLFVIIYKSQQRKKLLLIKEKEILLRNKELSSIDAMVAGQAEERQRIADDLHDNLGGLLATLKLYIENLKVKTNRLDQERDTLIEKTDEILEQAYQKVRSLAHDRNSGNPISQGLLPAIKEYAAGVTGSNKLIIEVHDQGQDKRIGNLIELTIFRIVQELITNVIKHAFAKAVTIDFTYFKDDLSIVFEDDGVGFDHADSMNKAEGMGLSSLKRRIDQLNGNLEIDSKIGHGTTIIINIPLS